MKTPHTSTAFSPFSEKALVLLISLVTLLLQLISFATTWNGSRIYLGNIFPHAPLCFAIAIQATAYFFSNSLRGRISLLKIIALCAAICCSTYYSYIGIYNSVNSPSTYLQEKYVRISQELTRIYDEETGRAISDTQGAVNDASSAIIAEYTGLLEIQQTIEACQTALSQLKSTSSAGLRAPRQSSYEKYEDYAAAYEAYIKSLSAAGSTETDAARQQTLSAYGFNSIEALNTAGQINAASLSALNAALGVTEGSPLDTVSALTVQLSTAINEVANGQPLTGSDIAALNRLFQAAGLCGYRDTALSQLTVSLDQCARVRGDSLLATYATLVHTLPEGALTDASMMELKASMDAEIMTALVKINSLRSPKAQISYTAPAYTITDLYLLPVEALQNTATRMTAFFCLSVAALIDILSVLFALSLRGRKPIWKRTTLLHTGMEDYAPLIYAALPDMQIPPADVFPRAPSASAASSAHSPATAVVALTNFLDCFRPSPQTESDGYMLRADMQDLRNYSALSALLCQVNLAKIIPAGFCHNDRELLLLKARFVFWANTIIYEEKTAEAAECEGMITT